MWLSCDAVRVCACWSTSPSLMQVLMLSYARASEHQPLIDHYHHSDKSSMLFHPPSQWHIDIDRLLNPFTPRNPLSSLPRPIAHFLGHRDQTKSDVGNVLIAFWACIGAFLDIILIEAVFMIPAIRQHGPPLLIASFVSASFLTTSGHQQTTSSSS